VIPLSGLQQIVDQCLNGPQHWRWRNTAVGDTFSLATHNNQSSRFGSIDPDCGAVFRHLPVSRLGNELRDLHEAVLRDFAGELADTIDIGYARVGERSIALSDEPVGGANTEATGALYAYFRDSMGVLINIIDGQVC